MNYSHIGWIPCINGHLDFGLMVPGIQGGLTDLNFIDRKTTLINFGNIKKNNHHARKIMLQSKVEWKDTKGPNFDGCFRVFVTAEANESECMDKRELKGSIYIYPLARETIKSGSNIDIDFPWFDDIHNAKLILNEYNKQSKSIIEDENKKTMWSEVQCKLNNIFDKLNTNLESGASKHIDKNYYKANFKVCSKGFCELSFCTTSSSQTPKSTEYIVLRQAFYYLKYSLHIHKHHGHDSDALTTIIPNDKDKVALKLIGQLKRELTSIKRTYSQLGYKKSDNEQGILAYMNSLCTSLKDKGYFTRDLYNRELDYLYSLESSFHAQKNFAEANANTISNIKEFNITIVTWLLAIGSLLWLTIFQHFVEMRPESSVEGEAIKKIVNIFSFSETIILAITVLICIFTTSYLLYRRKVKRSINTVGLQLFIENKQSQDWSIFYIGVFIKISFALIGGIATLWPWYVLFYQ